VARFLFEHRVDHKPGNLVARFAPPKMFAYVVIDHGEQASTQIAVSR